MGGGRKDLLTAFEVMEHLDEPIEEIGKWFDVAENILVSTQLNSSYDQEGEKWWYFNYESGQHIVLYNETTMQYIADYFTKKYIKINNNLHLLTSRDINEKKMKAVLKGNNIEKAYRMNAAKSKVIDDRNYLKERTNMSNGI